MKKLFTLFAATLCAAAVSAQTVQESKTFDNVYVGVNGGVISATKGHALLQDLNPNAGLRIGRWFTPVFGLAAEGNAYFRNTGHACEEGTVVKGITASLLGTVNLSNWFAGYKGEPRAFEVIGVYGMGFGKTLKSDSAPKDIESWTSKAGLDLAFNFGASKQWQVYVEPAIVWALHTEGDAAVKYNLNNSGLQLNAGIVYKFKNSNGTHNFKIAELRDQSEIDALNAKINGLRDDLNGKDAALAAKDRKIADLQKALDECNKKPVYEKPATATNLQPTVLFRQGKSVIDAAQYAPIELIAQYMKNHPDAKVEIKGYASPEGSKEFNQKLSEKRAAAVKDALVKKYKIAADRLTTVGMGETDKLFEQVEFNRVATFNDNTK